LEKERGKPKEGLQANNFQENGSKVRRRDGKRMKSMQGSMARRSTVKGNIIAGQKPKGGGLVSWIRGGKIGN